MMSMRHLNNMYYYHALAAELSKYGDFGEGDDVADSTSTASPSSASAMLQDGTGSALAGVDKKQSAQAAESAMARKLLKSLRSGRFDNKFLLRSLLQKLQRSIEKTKRTVGDVKRDVLRTVL